MPPEDPERGHMVDEPQREPRQVRLPRFLTDEDVGLGDVIKRATLAVGIQPCGNCAKRAETMNRWVRFSSRRAR